MSEAESAPTPSRTVGPLGCVSTAIIFIIIAILPFFFCRLVNQGQLEFGEPGQNQTRIFLLQEPGQEGLGIQRTRIRDESQGCIETSVRFWMLEGEALNNTSCTCSGESSGTSLPAGCTVP